MEFTVVTRGRRARSASRPPTDNQSRDRGPRDNGPRDNGPRDNRPPDQSAPRDSQRRNSTSHDGFTLIGSGGKPVRKGLSGKEDDEAFNKMTADPLARRFFWQLFRDRMGAVDAAELQQLMEDATKIGISDREIRHQFCVKLMKEGNLFSPTGLLTKCLISWIGRITLTEAMRKCLKLTLELLGEIIDRIPGSMNTMQYTTGILAVVGRLPLDGTLNQEVRSLHGKTDQTSSTIVERVNDPEKQWSPDLSFIKDGIVPDNMEEFIKYTLPNTFTHPAKGGYKSPAHYLECWYRIMHEDFYGPLREAIIMYRAWVEDHDEGREPRLQGGYLYHIKRITRREKYQQYYRYLIEFDRTKLKHVVWKETDRLRGGSLLVLSNDRFQTARFATIFTSHEGRVPLGQVWIQMIGGPLKLRQNFDAIESMNYFEPYNHVLQRLRVLAGKIDVGVPLPLSRYLVEGQVKAKSPAYQSSSAIIKLPHGETTARQLNFGQLSLDLSQRKALQLAFSHEFALIQGPPGTGKSYLGASFVRILMMNKDLWQRHDHGCIMLMAYKNHAIDQFIHDCEGMGIDMSGTIRLGGRGDISIEKYLLKNKKRELSKYREFQHMNREFGRLYAQLREIEQKIACVRAVVESKQPEFHTYRDYIPPHILHQLTDWGIEEPNSTVMMQWLDVPNTFQHIEQTPVPSFLEVDNICRRYAHIFQIPVRERLQLFVFWREAAMSDAQECLAVLCERRAVLNEQLEHLRRAEDIIAVHRADIIAMTTSGASKHAHIVEAVRPTIVLVEEAAEVLEPHIVAPLTQGCKHVVLIGDHQQLRPTICNINMERRNLHISLFERLINNDIRSQRLQVQHRMHPEISEILVPHIYSSLDNHEKVYKYPEVVGMKRRIHFIEHEHMEEMVGEKTSRRNQFEAEYMAALCHYLLQQDYSPSDITILATYMEQKRLISEKIDEYCARFPEPVYTLAEGEQMLKTEFKDYLAEVAKTSDQARKKTDFMEKRGIQYQKRRGQLGTARSKMKDVLVTTVDNYQGEECKIILLSFVRSNAAGAIGFLKWANRTCVALSRAQHGFYAIGNFKLFAQNTKTDLWKNLSAQMKLKPESIMSDTLELKCKNHGKVTFLKDPKLLPMVAPDGGCQVDCEVSLECGHQCRRKCHAYDMQHENYVCREPCEGKLSCDHPCGKICYSKGDDQDFFLSSKFAGTGRVYRDCDHCKKKLDCTVTVTVHPKSCDHIGESECALVEAYRCKKKVMYDLPCKHQTKAVCGTDVARLTCYEKVEYELPCSHRQNERCGTALSSIKCQTKVDAYSPCNEHRIRKICSEETRPCMVTIQDLLPCLHPATKLCHVNKSTIKCFAQDTVVLPKCQHEYMITCHQRKDVESRVDTIKCFETIGVDLPKCDHPYRIQCHERDTVESKIDSIKCMKTTFVKLPNCDHLHSILCHTREEVESHIEDVLCTRPVDVKRPKCAHPVRIECHERKVTEGKIDSIKCLESVTVNLPKCEHTYRTKCHEKEDIELGVTSIKCRESVTAILPQCEHTYPIKCYKKDKIESEVTSIKCPEPVTAIFPKCQHNFNCKCHEKDGIESGTSSIKCIVPVTVTLPKCGHLFQTKCHEKEDIESGVTIIKCLQQVTATLPKCGHPLYHTECHKKDAVETEIDAVKCATLVTATLPNCGHPYETKCHQKDDIESGRVAVNCARGVLKTLVCGHQKTVMCWQKDEKYDCGMFVPRQLARCEHRARVMCGAPDPPCDKLIPKQLTCGHLTHVPCADPDRQTEPCMVQTTSQLDCGHTVTFPCSFPVCPVMVKQKLPCRHAVLRKCSEIQTNPNVVCMETVKEKRECGHKITRKCSQKVTELCREKRTGTRRCGHVINAKCHDFAQRQAAACQEKVSVFRYCGHKANIVCHERDNKAQLRPCKEMCLITCRHKLRCKKACDAKCQRCINPCLNKCLHSKCTKLCNEECNRNACNEPCPEGLLCGHDCTGFCGEVCPQVCPECRTNLPKGRRVRLSCNHDIMAEQLDAHMRVQENEHVQEVVVKFCPLPHCGAVIQQCPRYANQIRRYLLLMKDADFYTEGLSWWYMKQDASFFSSTKGERFTSVTIAAVLAPPGNDRSLSSYYSTDMDHAYRYDADNDWRNRLADNAIYRQMSARLRKTPDTESAFDMNEILDELPSLDVDDGRENWGMNFSMEDSDSDDNFYGNYLEETEN